MQKLCRFSLKNVLFRGWSSTGCLPPCWQCQRKLWVFENISLAQKPCLLKRVFLKSDCFHQHCVVLNSDSFQKSVHSINTSWFISLPFWTQKNSLKQKWELQPGQNIRENDKGMPSTKEERQEDDNTEDFWTDTIWCMPDEIRLIRLWKVHTC